MPSIESVRVVDDKQRVAQVRVGRSEILVFGQSLPHFEGRQYRVLGGIRLIETEWQKGEPEDTRLVEVVVALVGQNRRKAR